MTEAQRQAKSERNRRYHERQIANRPIRSFESDGYPLRLRLQRLLATIKQRCRVQPTYKGVSCDLTHDDLRKAWLRDGAENMARPSIDRIDNSGDYTAKNIRFIELAENIRRGVKVRDAKRRVA